MILISIFSGPSTRKDVVPICERNINHLELRTQYEYLMCCSTDRCHPDYLKELLGEAK